MSSKFSSTYLNRFEIEAKLPSHLRQKYQLIRTTKKEDIEDNDRHKPTRKRVEHWETLSDRLSANALKQLLPENQSSKDMTDNNNNMAEAFANAYVNICRPTETTKQYFQQ